MRVTHNQIMNLPAVWECLPLSPFQLINLKSERESPACSAQTKSVTFWERFNSFLCPRNPLKVPPREHLHGIYLQ